MRVCKHAAQAYNSSCNSGWDSRGLETSTGHFQRSLDLSAERVSPAEADPDSAQRSASCTATARDAAAQERAQANATAAAAPAAGAPPADPSPKVVTAEGVPRA